MKKKRATKSKGVRSLSAKKVGAKHASRVRGGVRKAGKEQQEYLVMKMNDLIISS